MENKDTRSFEVFSYDECSFPLWGTRKPKLRNEPSDFSNLLTYFLF